MKVSEKTQIINEKIMACFNLFLIYIRFFFGVFPGNNRKHGITNCRCKKTR